MKIEEEEERDECRLNINNSIAVDVNRKLEGIALRDALGVKVECRLLVHHPALPSGATYIRYRYHS